MATVMGLFEYVDAMLEAADRVKKLGYEVTILSSVPLNHEIEHALGERKNHVKWFTGFGAVNGFFFGTVFAFGTAMLYVLPRSGRPILTITPTLLISYETTILFGVLWTLLGFFVLCRLPSFRKRPFHPNIAEDQFGLLVEEIGRNKSDEIEKIMKEHGACEVVRGVDG
ncbi:MAG: DUF3341 domain-containing protein [Deltaproteobacteria bacterium]|nr:DUF3341 domain-containing protein [Deltaproteobacteria bacterium]